MIETTLRAFNSGFLEPESQLFDIILCKIALHVEPQQAKLDQSQLVGLVQRLFPSGKGK